MTDKQFGVVIAMGFISAGVYCLFFPRWMRESARKGNKGKPWENLLFTKAIIESDMYIPLACFIGAMSLFIGIAAIIILFLARNQP
jgi:hypothetical protein